MDEYVLWGIIIYENDIVFILVSNVRKGVYGILFYSYYLILKFNLKNKIA